MAINLRCVCAGLPCHERLRGGGACAWIGNSQLIGVVKAAIWANETETGVRHNVTIQRIYKDGDVWKTSASFGRDDLPLVAKVADMAHTWIFQEGKSGSGSDRSEAETGNES